MHLSLYFSFPFLFVSAHYSDLYFAYVFLKPPTVRLDSLQFLIYVCFLWHNIRKDTSTDADPANLAEAIQTATNKVEELKRNEPPNQEAIKSAVTDLCQLKDNYLSAFARQPGNPFHALKNSSVCESQPKLAGDGTLLWELKCANDVPCALAALLNSHSLGCLQLPSNTPFDNVAGVIRYNLSPSLTLSIHAAAPDKAGTLVSWDGTNHVLHVLATTEQVYFYGVKIRRRIGATCTLLTSKELVTRLLDIDTVHATQKVNVSVIFEEEDNTVDHLQPAAIEGDILENKKKMWWMTEGDSLPTSWKDLAEKLKVHVQRYVVEMYVLNFDRRVPSAQICIGVRDDGCVAVGVPLTDDLSKSKFEVQKVLSQEMAHLFPSPALELNLEWTELKTSKSLQAAFGLENRTVFISNFGAIKSVAMKVEWILAAKLSSPDGGHQLGAVFASCDAFSLEKKEAEIYQLFWKDKLLVRSSHVRLIDKDQIEIIPHVLVTVLIKHRKDEQPASAALFGPGSFGFSALLRRGEKNISALQLSPFATWAMLRHRLQAPNVSNILGHSQLKGRVVADEEARSHLPKDIDPTLFAESLDAVAATEEVCNVVCLGLTLDEVKKCPREGVKKVLYLLDIDAQKLQ